MKLMNEHYDWVQAWKDKMSARERDYISKLEQDNAELAKDHNIQVNIIQNTLAFMAHQCNLLRSAMTGSFETQNPFELMSSIGVRDEMQDLAFLRNGLCVFTTTLIETHDGEKALDEWQKYIAKNAGGNNDGWINR